jgi:hypothetical protein
MLNVRVCMFAACVGGIKQCKLSIGNNTTYAETFLPASSDRSSIFVVDVGRRSLTKAKMQNNVACRWCGDVDGLLLVPKPLRKACLVNPLRRCLTNVNIYYRLLFK